MALIPGTIPATGTFAPTDSTDTFAIVDMIYSADGLRNVQDKIERNAISLERRKAGMLVGTQDSGEYWKLLPGPWAFDDTDWSLFLGANGASNLGDLLDVNLVSPIADQDILIYNIGTGQWENTPMIIPNLQNVLDIGSTASIANVFSIDVTGPTFSGGTGKIVIYDAVSAFAHENIGGFQSNIQFSDASMLVNDDINNKGLVYAANYSANFTARSLIDKEYVDNLADLDGVYGGDGTIPTITTSTITDTHTFYKASPTSTTSDVMSRWLDGTSSQTISTAVASKYSEFRPVDQVTGSQVITSGNLITPIITSPNDRTYYAGADALLYTGNLNFLTNTLGVNASVSSITIASNSGTFSGSTRSHVSAFDNLIAGATVDIAIMYSAVGLNGYNTHNGTTNRIYGFHMEDQAGKTGNVPSAANRFGLYIEDDGYNYLAGRLGIRTNVPSADLEVNGSVRLSGLTTTAVSGYILQSINSNGDLDWVDPSTIVTSIPNLSDVLIEGNTTGVNDIIIDTNQVIQFEDQSNWIGRISNELVIEANLGFKLDITNIVNIVKGTLTFDENGFLQLINIDNGSKLELSSVSGDISYSDGVNDGTIMMPSSLSGSKTWEFQDTSGIIALLGDVPTKYKEEFTPGTVGVPNSISHNLNTVDITVQLWNNNILITADTVEIIDNNTVEVTFTGSNPTGDVKIIIVGI